VILKLTGNRLWHLSFFAQDGKRIGRTMAEAMRIQTEPLIHFEPAKANARRLIVCSSNPPFPASIEIPPNFITEDPDIGSSAKLSSKTWIERTTYGSFWAKGWDTVCVLPPCDNADEMAQQLLLLSLIIGRQVEEDGGLMIHGALLKQQDGGIILAGPSAVGKSTACKRMPSSWQCLCDDMTLLAKDEHDCFWAHPWPTWSRFMNGEPGDRWDVQSAVPLRGIFILSQAKIDQAEKLGAGHAVPLLLEVAEQAARPIFNSMEREKARACRLKRFETICTLAKTLPCYHLKISRTGEFWREIERALGQSHDAGNP
jgi:SynChlorMet cassette protein ScmC